MPQISRDAHETTSALADMIALLALQHGSQFARGYLAMLDGLEGDYDRGSLKAWTVQQVRERILDMLAMLPSNDDDDFGDE